MLGLRRCGEMGGRRGSKRGKSIPGDEVAWGGADAEIEAAMVLL